MSRKIIISFKFSDIRPTTEASYPSSAKQRISEALLSECEHLTDGIEEYSDVGMAEPPTRPL
jgi:hypothetical protein